MLKKLFDYHITGHYYDLVFDTKTNRSYRQKKYIKKWYFVPFKQLQKRLQKVKHK